MRCRIRPWPLRASMAVALPAALAAVLLGPAGPAHAAGTTLYVANPGKNTVSVVDTSSNTITATIPVGTAPQYTAVTPDGSQVFVTNRLSNTVSVISTSSDTVTATVPVPNSPEEVAVDPAGQFAYVATNQGQVVKIATATDTAVGTVFVGESPYALAISPNGATLYVSASNSGDVSIVDTATLKVSSVIFGGGSGSRAMTISPDGSNLYVAYDVGLSPNPSPNVTVISTATDTVTAHIPVSSSPGQVLAGIAITPGGSSVYVSDENTGAVSVISTAANAVTGTIQGFKEPTGIAINSAGTTGWIADAGTSTLSVFDPATNTVTGTITGFDGSSWGISVSTSLFEFVGFLPPVGGQPTVNQANAGQAIPMKFSLTGNQGLNIFNTGYPAVQQVDCTSGVPVNTSTLTDTSGASGLQYDATSDTYTYVWKTSKSWAGTCQKFILGLNDGSTHTATFQFQ